MTVSGKSPLVANTSIYRARYSKFFNDKFSVKGDPSLSFGGRHLWVAAIGRWRRWLAPRATSSLPCQPSQPPPSTAHTSRSLAWEDAGDKKLIL